MSGSGRRVVISGRGLVKRFGATRVLDHVDLTVHEGEIVTLIGPNGSGKTTLVRILLGLADADGGEIHRPGTVSIGYVPQRLEIDETLPLTVGRFLALPRRRGRNAITAALDEVGAPHVFETPLDRISGGEMRRVLLARALLRDPDLLVLDEPAAGVDVAGQADLYDLIRRLRDRRGCAILVVSHDLHLVMAATDQVVCLNHHVCCHGRPELVAKHPAYLELFGPRIGKTMAVYAHHHNHRHALSGEAVDEGRDNG